MSDNAEQEGDDDDDDDESEEQQPERRLRAEDSPPRSRSGSLCSSGSSSTGIVFHGSRRESGDNNDDSDNDNDDDNDASSSATGSSSNGSESDAVVILGGGEPTASTNVSGRTTTTTSQKGKKRKRPRKGGALQHPPKDSSSVPGTMRETARNDRRELTDALEHLLVVGGHNRHEVWRIQQWKKVRTLELRVRAAGLPQPTFAHHRDDREYSKINGSSDIDNDKDEKWDAARFGDGVDLLHLYDHSRSSHDGRDAVRRTVLRAWERAMSVASQTVPVPLTTPPPPDPSGADPKRTDNDTMVPERASDVRPLPTRATAMATCQRLQIPLRVFSRSCPTCEVEFDTPERASTHYYGTDAVRGCCWTAIHQRQRSVLFRALQNQVLHQSDQMLRALTVQYAHVPPHTQWDWQDVLGALTRATNVAPAPTATTAASTPHSPAVEGLAPTDVSHTICVEDDKPPIVLNRLVLHATMRQLVDRYANVPR